MKRRTINSLKQWRLLVLFPLAWLVRLWGRTLRFRLSSEEERILSSTEVPLLFVLWHNRLFVTAEIYRRYRKKKPIHALISASRDGAWLAAFFSLCGLQAVRGSSSWRGKQAFLEMAAFMKKGHDIAVTPDGPRGPCYDMKKGPALLAFRGGQPVLLLGARFYTAWRTRSWDRFYLPLPFSTVELRVEKLEPDAFPARADEMAALMRERLMALSPDCRMKRRLPEEEIPPS